MAINKITKTANGLDMSYHKVVRLNINWLDRTADVVVYSYQDRDQRDAYPLNPMGSFVRNYSGVDFPFTVEGNNVEQAYLKLIESKKETIVITPASEGIEEVTEEVETNEFAGAEEI